MNASSASVLLGLLTASSLTGADTGSIAISHEPHGGRVGWARIITPSHDWDIHGDNDVSLAGFIRAETNLNLDPQCHSVDPARLADLCAYPLLYVKDLSSLRSRDAFENLRQYLRRGGFICIDACLFVGVTPDIPLYVRTNCDLLRQLIPGVEIKLLPPDHPIYRSYFVVRDSDIFTADTKSFRKAQPNGLYGVFDGARMIAVVSTDELECGWPQAPLRAAGCMKMIVNIYVYAMTR